MDNIFNNKTTKDVSHNTPLDRTQNAHLESLGLYGNKCLYSKRRHTKRQAINRMAIEKYKGTGKGDYVKVSQEDSRNIIEKMEETTK